MRVHCIFSDIYTEPKIKQQEIGDQHSDVIFD